MAAVAKLVYVSEESNFTLREPARSAPEAIDLCAFAPIRSREEAETLLMLDHSRSVIDTEWTAYFVEAMVSFLIWQNQPWGTLSESDLDWFLGISADAPSQSLPCLLFALVREINEVPERLMAMAMKHNRNRLAVMTSR